MLSSYKVKTLVIIEFFKAFILAGAQNTPIIPHKMRTRMKNSPEQSKVVEIFRHATARAVGMVALYSTLVASGSTTEQQPYEIPSVNTDETAVAIQPTYEPEPQIVGETLIMPKVADPDVYKENNNSFFLSGTNKLDTDIIPIYHSSNLVEFQKINEYDPDLVDPNNDYCHLWAPTITHDDGKYQMFFTTRQTQKGQDCDGSSNEQAIFYAESDTDDMNFGPPQPINTGQDTPRTHTRQYCPPRGCSNALRIDPEIARSKNGDKWLFYNWFGLGQNVIAAVNLDNPSQRHTVAMPGYGDNSINEAPDVFERNGKYYMIYSRDWFNANYGLSYISADSIAKLTRQHQSSHEISTVERRDNGQLHKNIGHSSVVKRNDKYFVFYHKGTFNENGKLTDRSTYAQELHFENDEIVSLQNEISG